MRAKYPVHLFLIHVLALVLLRADVTLTSSYIKGVENVRADAASRNFLQQDGLLTEMQLAGFQPVPFCSTAFKSVLERMSTLASGDISQILPAARMAAAGLLGLSSL
jgi:hypothetical protein